MDRCSSFFSSFFFSFFCPFSEVLDGQAASRRIRIHGAFGWGVLSGHDMHSFRLSRPFDWIDASIDRVEGFSVVDGA